MKYRVLLYYKYTTIEKPEIFAKKHLSLCKSLNLKGRILVSKEGINGTISGKVKFTDLYIQHMINESRFKDTYFKVDEAECHTFRKLFVRCKKELVRLDLKNDINPKKMTGKYLSPIQFKQALLEKEAVILDVRNNYESNLGHFRGAVCPDICNFRELPQWFLSNKNKFSKKKIITYCTGGIRCEKFSGWLLKQGMKDVFQLEGGIAAYGKDTQTKGQLWDGKMYVFDDRISVNINHIDRKVVGKDWFDGTPCERYINCANPKCNRQILSSKKNERKYLGSCCYECSIVPNNRYIKRTNISNSSSDTPN